MLEEKYLLINGTSDIKIFGCEQFYDLKFFSNRWFNLEKFVPMYLYGLISSISFLAEPLLMVRHEILVNSVDVSVLRLLLL